MRSIERVVTLECAGNGRLAMRPLPAGEPWGDYAVSTARWKGALLHEVLEQAKPLDTGVEVLFAGVDHGSYILNPVLKDVDASDLSFERSLTLVHAADPSAEILIAYEMNGEPLNPDHGAPFRLIVPHWYGVASVKWLTRIEVLTQPFIGEFETGHYMYQWADRPPERVTVMRPRARITDPRRGATINGGREARRPRQGLVGHRTGDERRHQPHRRIRMAASAPRDAQRAHTSGRTGRSNGSPRNQGARASAPVPPMPPGTSNPKSRSGTGSATATTPSKSSTSTFDEPAAG